VRRKKKKSQINRDIYTRKHRFNHTYEKVQYLKGSSYSSVGVEHNSKGGSHSFGWKIFWESSSDYSVASVSLGNSAPHDSESAIQFGGLSFEDISNSLSKVEGSVFFVIDTLDLEQSEIFVLGCNTSF